MASIPVTPFPYSQTYQIPYPQTIVRKGHPRYEEYPANATYIPITPGMLMALESDGSVGYHNAAGGNPAPLRVAIEDSLQGGTISTNYTTSGQIVRCVLPKEGDKLLMLLAVGATSTNGDLLMSNGDGTLVPAWASGLAYQYTGGPSAGLNGATTTTQTFAPTYTLAAGQFVAGDTILITGQLLVTGHHTADTLNCKLLIGSTVICATGVVTNAVNDIIEFNATLTIQSVGASGSFIADGYVTDGVPGTATALPFSLGPTAINTTAAQAITMTAIWANSSTSASIVVAEEMEVFITRINGATKVAQNETPGTTNNSLGSTPVVLDVVIL